MMFSLWLAALALAGGAGLAQTRHEPVALRDLVRRGDPLAAHDLWFDARFAQSAVDYLRNGDPGILDRLAKLPAAAHLLNHARNFDYDVPKDSTAALVAGLLAPPAQHRDRIDACTQAVGYFYGPMLRDPQWVSDVLRYLPDDFRFHGSLFLQFGYDIGVAFSPAASLNCASRHFEEHPAEITYYAIHELHHAGFMTYQPPPRLADLKTCADLLRLVKYSTQLEGMAVWVAYARRQQEGALAEDGDYAALADEAGMQRDEASYFEELHRVQRRGAEPADAAAWAVINQMSDARRLWYRVGARMSKRIERDLGRPALVELIRKGPDSFLETYLRLTSQPPR